MLEKMQNLAATNNTAGASIYDLGKIMQSDSMGSLNIALKQVEQKNQSEQAEERAHQEKMMQAQAQQAEKEKAMQLDHDAQEKEKYLIPIELDVILASHIQELLDKTPYACQTAAVQTKLLLG